MHGVSHISNVPKAEYCLGVAGFKMSQVVVLVLKE